MEFNIDDEWLNKAEKRYAVSFVGGTADRVPVDPMMLSHSTVLYGYTIRDFYAYPELAVVCLAQAQQRYDLLPVTKYYFAHPWLPELGIELKPMDYTAPVPVNVVVRDPEDADKISIPDSNEIKGGYSYERLTRGMDYIKNHKRRMLVPLAYCPEPVGSAAELCGIEQFLMWTQTELDLCKKLIEIYVETAVSGAELLAKRYGTALINTGAVLENSDTMSPETIKKISPPALSSLVKKCLSKGAGPQIFYHFCGNHKDDYALFTNKIVFTPLTIMQIGYWEREPFPAEIMKSVYGRVCTIMPSVDTKLFVLRNSRKIYEQAKQQLINGRDTNNGFILGTSCEVPPFSYQENIDALVRAANDFGSLKKS